MIAQIIQTTIIQLSILHLLSQQQYYSMYAPMMNYAQGCFLKLHFHQPYLGVQVKLMQAQEKYVLLLQGMRVIIMFVDVRYESCINKSHITHSTICK